MGHKFRGSTPLSLARANKKFEWFVWWSIMGAWGNILGVLFFACLVFAGITSAVSLVEAISAAITDKVGWERKKVVTTMCIIGFVLSTAFATNAGLYY